MTDANGTEGRRFTRPGAARLRYLTIILAVTTAILAGLLTMSVGFGWPDVHQSSSVSTPQVLSMTGIDRNFEYENGTIGAIGPAVNDSCAQCPFSFSAGSVVSVTLFTYRMNTTFPKVAMRLFVTSTIPAEPVGGYSCPGAAPCPPPHVTSSSFILIYPGTFSLSWEIIFDPPANATVSDDGAVSITAIVTTCSSVNSDWNWCG
jgi:hypothetical protein